MQTIQNIMWHYVGLIRSGDRLARAIRELRHLQNEIETFYQRTKLSDGLIGLRNAVEVALIVAQAAYHNRQSRGRHYRRACSGRLEIDCCRSLSIYSACTASKNFFNRPVDHKQWPSHP